jgi:glycosyltransferase involved in cell wall biosynthesis
MTTIHLVYPHDRNRRTKSPWSIGYNLAAGLRKRGHKVRCYDWADELCIYPDSPDDILIGHPHPEPGKCFRTSMVAPWKRVVSIAPWNGSEEYRRDQEYVWGKVDHHFAICGKPWFWDTPESPRFNTWSEDTQTVHSSRLDMAIDPQYFPPLKPSYNPPGERRFLYIGCTVQQKGTKYLEDLIKSVDSKRSVPAFGHLGHGHVEGTHGYGFRDLAGKEGHAIASTYDYLIMPGTNDANPTTVLEAMSWGLIPVLSTGCGYVDGDFHGYTLQRDCKADAELVASLQRADETTLQDLAAKNRELVRSRYTWQRFVNSVALVLEA